MPPHPAAKIPLTLIELENISIFDQLLYEEYLLRDTQDIVYHQSRFISSHCHGDFKQR